MDAGFFASLSGLSGSVLHFLMQQSLYAAAVAVVVWTVLAIVRPRHPLLHLTLWWFVLARLVLPADFATSWSLRASAETMLAQLVWPQGVPHVNLVGGEGAVPVASRSAMDMAAPVAEAAAPAAASAPADFLPLALLVLWAGGAAAMLILLGRAERSARRTIALAEPAGVPLLEQLADAWARRFGISRRVRVLVTAEAAAPFTAGVLRPVIVLPRTLLARLDEVELSAVIGHEMSHIRSFDVVWRMVERVLLVLFFFHPMVWMAVRRIDTAREAACDVSAASSGLIARASYARGLLAALKAFRLEPEVAFARTLSIQGGTGNGLKTRLVWLKGETSMSTPAKLLGAAGVVGLGLLVLPMAEARQSIPQFEAEPLLAPAAPAPAPAPAAPAAPEAPAAPAVQAVALPPAPPATSPATPPAPPKAAPSFDFDFKFDEEFTRRIEAGIAEREAAMEAALEAADVERTARLAAAEARREARLAAAEAKREARLAAAEARRNTAQARREIVDARELSERIRRDVLRSTAESLRATAREMRQHPERFAENQAFFLDHAGKRVQVETDPAATADRLEAEAARLEQRLKDI